MTIPKKFSHLDVLLGFKRSIQNDYLTVWCPHCAQWHNHGTEAGHVVAHCKDERSPYRETGYYIKKISNKEMDRLIEKYEGEEANE